jgi:hypothetical protein
VRKALPERPGGKLIPGLPGHGVQERKALKNLRRLYVSTSRFMVISGVKKKKGPDRNPAGPQDEKGLEQ